MGMTERQHFAVSNLLWIFGSTKPREFHHGDCEGADVQAARIANWYHYRIICHPPVKNDRRGWYKFNDIIKPAHDYIIRDQEIVDDSQVLIATPHTPYEVTRSGTWTTIRYARDNQCPIYIVKPDGTVETENI